MFLLSFLLGRNEKRFDGCVKGWRGMSFGDDVEGRGGGAGQARHGQTSRV